MPRDDERCRGLIPCSIGGVEATSGSEIKDAGTPPESKKPLGRSRTEIKSLCLWSWCPLPALRALR